MLHPGTSTGEPCAHQLFLPKRQQHEAEQFSFKRVFPCDEFAAFAGEISNSSVSRLFGFAKNLESYSTFKGRFVFDSGQ